MKTLRLSALAMAAAVGISGAASATELTIAIVNNGHMINMQRKSLKPHQRHRCKAELGITRRRCVA